MKEIALTQGYVALVDDEDFARVSRLKWHADWSPSGWYAKAESGGRQVRMHRYIIGAPPDVDVDHRNGNTLDNRRKNLRPATPSGNAANQRIKPHSSKYKGVRKHRDGKWEARIRHQQRLTYLGLHPSEEQAARAYDRAARELFGEFARTNFD